MATIAFNSASDQLTQVRGQGHNPLDPINDGGRVRVKQFAYTATGAVGTGSTLELVELPQGALVVDTVLTDLTLSNSAELSVGYTDKSAPTDDSDAALLSATATADSADASRQFVTVGTNGVQSVFATTSVGALAADDTFTGAILYVVNT